MPLVALYADPEPVISMSLTRARVMQRAAAAIQGMSALP